jgi:hypothetical protein
VICTIEETKNLAELSVDELADSLLAHEQRKKLKKKESLKEAIQEKFILEEKALYVQKAQQTHSRGVMDDVTEKSRVNRAQTRRGEGAEMATIEKKTDVNCYNYRKYGHYARNYWAAKKVEGNPNYTEVMKEKVLLIAQTPSTSGCHIIWYLDRGASNHI